MPIIEPPTDSVRGARTVAAMLAAAYLAEQDLPDVYDWDFRPQEGALSILLLDQGLAPLTAWAEFLGGTIQTRPWVVEGKLEAWCEVEFRAAHVRVYIVIEDPAPDETTRPVEDVVPVEAVVPAKAAPRVRSDDSIGEPPPYSDLVGRDVVVTYAHHPGRQIVGRLTAINGGTLTIRDRDEQVVALPTMSDVSVVPFPEPGSNPNGAWLPGTVRPVTAEAMRGEGTCMHCQMPIRIGPPNGDGSPKWHHIRTDMRACGDNGTGPYAWPAAPQTDVEQMIDL